MFFIFLHHICLAYAKVFLVLEPIKEEVGRRRAKKKKNSTYSYQWNLFTFCHLKISIWFIKIFLLGSTNTKWHITVKIIVERGVAFVFGPLESILEFFFPVLQLHIFFWQILCSYGRQAPPHHDAATTMVGRCLWNLHRKAVFRLRLTWFAG